ncbi:MAG: AAA family ATPase, partial [Hyphomonadaceae bacterium]
MHIAELRLSGFKSFVDHVRAPIEPGLTGVVGPNGCGKSNLLEAVRWVMGTTSAKSMRADDMDAVIFSGSAARPAREHAEVTLVLKDAQGRGPGSLASDDVLEVSRRIRRGLGSTYRINGKEVRAKDVQLLFADASTGANSPALVRQGQVSELIAAKPENRRRILEEAAGIAGLHARRHEADLKLKSAESNLARLDEILAEIEAQAASLKKQARQAERYRGLAAALRETEALLLHRRWMEAKAAVASVEQELRETERAVAEAATAASQAAREAESAREALQPLREEEAVASAVLRRLEGVRVGHERDLQQAEEKVARAEADIERLGDEASRLADFANDAAGVIARLEADLAETPENDAAQAGALEDSEAKAKAAEAKRGEAEARVEALAAESAARMARARTLAESAGAARERLTRLTDRLGALNTSLKVAQPSADLQARIAQAQCAAEAAQRESSAARDALAKAENALKQAEAADEAAWAPSRTADALVAELQAEVRALDQLAPPPSGRAFPAVLQSIAVSDGYERALAAALGDDIEASTNEKAPLRWSGADVRAIDWPEGVASLSDHVEAPGELAARLALIGLVDAARGADLQKSLPTGARLVSREGDLWRWDGFVRRADAPAPAAARLEQRNRLKAARAELKSAEEKRDRARAMAQETQAKRRVAEEEARKARAVAPQLASKAAEAARKHETLQSEAKLAEERVAALAAQIEQLSAERAEAEAQAAHAASAASGAPAGGEEALATARAEMESARAAAAEARALFAGLAREHKARLERRAALEADLSQWRTRQAQASARLDAIEAERDKARAAREAALAAPEQARAALEKLLSEQQQAETRRAGALDKVAEAERRVREVDQAARERENHHALARERRAAAEARLAGAGDRLNAIETQAREATGLAPDNLAGAAGNLISQAIATGLIADVEKKLERLRAERESAGPVNLRA